MLCTDDVMYYKQMTRCAKAEVQTELEAALRQAGEAEARAAQAGSSVSETFQARTPW